MGTTHRTKPARLAKKLKMIRESLGLTYEQLIERLGKIPTPLYKSSISRFESGSREPSLLVLLQYARIAGISTDILIDDQLDLPKRFLDSNQKQI